MQAALTGHLVLTTVHSKDPVRLFLQDDGFWYFRRRITSNHCLYFSAALDPIKSGKMGAVFEIIQGEKLGKVADAIIEGERVVIAVEERVETLIKKYQKASVMNDE